MTAERRPGPGALPSAAYEHLVPLFRERDELGPDDPRRELLRRRLICGHLPLARRVARRHARRGEDVDDLEQVAAVGLIKAVDRYSPHRGAPFPTFAVPTITGEILHHRRDRIGAVRIPRPVRELQPGVLRATADLGQRMGREPRAAELAERLGVDTSRVHEVVGSFSGGTCRSLDQPTRDRTGAVRHYDAVLGGADHRLDVVEQRCVLEPLLAALDERQRRILALRFGHDLTQAEIGRRVGLTQMGVSRQLAAILSTLRTALGGAGARVR